METLKKKRVVKENNGQVVVEGRKIPVLNIPAVQGVINGRLKIDDGDNVDIEFRGNSEREELYFYWLREPHYFFLLAKKEDPHTELAFWGDELKVGSHQIGWGANEVQAEFFRHGSTGYPQSESRGSLTVLFITEEGGFDVIEGHFSFNYIDYSEEKPRDVVFSCPTFRLRVPK
ncbi:hypothetical protein PMI29_01650 [Pseudomonas sp. GM49]|uniref:hypothetical protein n=1 Tax=Pseudomonas sp. GM49 TaxID=1144331 RepID=UPI000270B902|nr:hypothetical protein [Pseudomonas sp. GM49]EJM70250.1 hypothetical protein PMI29_01650 [Pseudomonas sp. GM49]